MSWLFPWTISVPSPIGHIVIQGQSGIQRVAFADAPPEAQDDADPIGAGDAVRRYLAGELRALDAIELQLEGTAYQQRVWQAVRGIPPGDTRTYGDIAESLHSVARAVGRANATNPAPLFVPCHRVVGGSGDLTGYAFGLERKRWLLEHESRELDLF
ncbi:MAG: methylated-DNA--[protein]-cysteine S-methyltransferase [Alphaproteobacteria bacterium]|nr:methylated-DNA--[protein]-cysteine S-methyltransferase [Alphaproteobacteria bacterium]